MLSLAKFIKKEIELRENLVGTGFSDPPPKIKTNIPIKDAEGKYVRNEEGEIETEEHLSSDYRVTVLGKWRPVLFSFKFR